MTDYEKKMSDFDTSQWRDAGLTCEEFIAGLEAFFSWGATVYQWPGVDEGDGSECEEETCHD